MSWLCPKCSSNNVSVNPVCVYCRVKHYIITAAPAGAELDYDDYQASLTAVRLYKLDKVIPLYPAFNKTGVNPVTPQEELFAGFFNDEKGIIGDMDTLTLRAHREELAKIAFEARARLTAVDDEERARKARAQKEKGPTGFSTSLAPDDITSDAIAAVKKRTARMSKMDKVKAGLAKLGIDTKDADSIMSAGTILGRVKGQAAVEASKPAVAFTNPFGKKEEPKPETVEVATNVTINEETNTVVVKTEEVVVEEPKASGFKSPFAK